MYLWPGLPQLWFAGLWSCGLLLATGFGVLLNVLLVASLVWNELLSPAAPHEGLAGRRSIVGVVGGNFRLGNTAEPAATGPASPEGLFRQALSEYLQRNWSEAETVLGGLLRREPADAEARLLRATLLRHTRRYTEALAASWHLDRLRAAELWIPEIAAERRLISEAQADAASQQNPTSEIPVLNVVRQAAYAAAHRVVFWQNRQTSRQIPPSRRPAAKSPTT